ncbi:uncharacterized protein MKK02DRAFT_44890 [Dioszegia hungarica]|uniref:DUF6534 domain-containing protein n=1 Tax=Dioszegia hungarica TaxID=4972 RepID=A0AA38H903_9TREE|nr:uncharacterized protein MKK02DRAFT_44890 [Dioszegia hungarica]KAI9636187.1 hypothetical protein MKK02DRAFT_44890 [Dioszegia hungarica]
MDQPAELDLNAEVWKLSGTKQDQVLIYVAVAVAAQGMILCVVLVTTGRYISHFRNTDSQLTRGGVILGSALACGAFGMQCFQLQLYVVHATSDIPSVLRTDALCNTAYRLLGGIFSLVAMTFYSNRIWRLSGRRWTVIVPLAVLIFSAFALMLATVVIGFTFPILTHESLPSMRSFFERQTAVVRAHGAVTFASDAIISGSLVYLLLRTRNSIFGAEGDRGIVSRILIIMGEAMVPPTIAIAVLTIGTSRVGGGAIIDWKRILFATLPLLYYQSLLYSLVARRKVRRLLDERGVAAQYRLESSHTTKQHKAAVGGSSSGRDGARVTDSAGREASGSADQLKGDRLEW